MQIQGERQLSLPPEEVFDGVLNPAILVAAIPGAETVTDEGNGVYRAVVLASVGPVRARFKGKVTMVEVTRPTTLRLEFEGESGMSGFATGSARVDLAARDGGTHLVWQADSQIGGRLAQIGSRLIDATVTRMSAQFFDRFEQVLTLGPETAPAAEPASAPVDPGRAAFRPAPGLAPAAAAGGVVLQMPSWVFVSTFVTLAALIGWLAVT